MVVDGVVTSPNLKRPERRVPAGVSLLQAGYRANLPTKYSTAVDLGDCAPIANCDLTSANNWMNACQTCESGSAWEMSSTFTLNFDRCVRPANPVGNCLIYQSDASGGHCCLLCKQGFVLNSIDGSCKTFALPGCDKMGLPSFRLEKSTDYPGDK